MNTQIHREKGNEKAPQKIEEAGPAVFRRRYRVCLKMDPQTAVRLVNAGLKWRDAVFVANNLGIPLEKFAGLLQIPRSTFFTRRKGRFAVSESDRILRYLRIFDVACVVMGSPEGARSWLAWPAYGLERNVPLEYAMTETGAERVTNLLWRIDHGIVA